MDSVSPRVAFSIMRLQRGLLRSETAFAGTEALGVTSVLGLILALAFAAATGEAPFPGCVRSGVGEFFAAGATRAGELSSALSGTGVEVCESAELRSGDAGGATAGVESVGAETDSLVACAGPPGVDGPPGAEGPTDGILGAFGSVSLVPTTMAAMPSAITAPPGRSHLRTGPTA